MTAEQLIKFLGAHGIDQEKVNIRDGAFVFPNGDWLFGTFAAGFAEARASFLPAGYEPEVSDCDDFAELAVVYSHLLHRLSVRKNAALSGKAIAFGSFDYFLGGDYFKGAHAINVAIVAPNGAPELVFFEPQSGKRVDLSKEEICSCLEVRF